MWRNWNSCTLFVEMPHGMATVENNKIFKKLKMKLSHNPAILLLDTYSKELKSGSQRDTSTPMFTAALFTIAKVWNNLDSHHRVSEYRKCGIHV